MGQSTETFRDHIATVNEAGKRVWIYPKETNGPLLKWRQRWSYIQLLILFGLPFLKINGHPAVMLNILERKFILFGRVFWPEDFYLFGLLMITLVVFIILFTATFGRVFCGWLCPQTVFLEMVFRRIERLIEGSPAKQKKLDQSPWTGGKFFKKSLKHGVFYGISFVIGNIFLSYIIGVEELWKIITDPPSQHLVGLSAMILFSLVFYGVFSRFREQVCVMVCPYGRLQSVLQDQNTLTISYDYKRGEPRGKGGKKNRSDQMGDCIDCGECVAVCPTGMDIRNGIQLECINCTACLDSCNTVMEKVDKPKGLIRYASHEMIEKGNSFRVTPRMITYGIAFILLLSLDLYLLATAPRLHTLINRIPGSTFLPMGDHYGNTYSLQMLNKTFSPHTYSLKLMNIAGKIRIEENPLTLPGERIHRGNFLILLPRDALKGKFTNLEIGIYEGETLIKVVKTRFLGPDLRREARGDRHHGKDRHQDEKKSKDHKGSRGD